MEGNNDLSFSLPTWRKQQIRLVSLHSEEEVYAATPFNLSDFRNQKAHSCLLLQPQPCEGEGFQWKREVGAWLEQEIGIFLLLWREVLEADHRSHPNDGQPLLCELKQKVMTMDLCQLKTVPSQYRNYYHNPLIKKVLFQYMGKCAYNDSLVELLIANNPMLQFSIVLLVKTVLFEATRVSNYEDEVEFEEEAEKAGEYFGRVLVRRKQEGMRRVVRWKGGCLWGEHYMLRKSHGKVYLYRRQPKVKTEVQVVQVVEQVAPTEKEEPEFDQDGFTILKKKQTQTQNHTFKVNSKPHIPLKERSTSSSLQFQSKKQKPEAAEQPRQAKPSPGWWSCLPCLNL